MTTTLGLAISSDRVSGVLMSRGSEKWAEVRVCDGSTSRREVITRLLSDCPRPRWVRRRVVAAIGPSGVQVKRLTDLPPACDRKALHAIVRESAGRFFLKNGAPLETTCELVPEDGTVWAAAYDGELIADIDRACRSANWRLRALVPVATALRLATPEQSVGWQDGDLHLDVTYHGAALVELRCARDAKDSSSNAAADDRRAHLLAAFGASQIVRGEPLAIQRSVLFNTRPSRTQLLVAAASFLLTFACWWFAPPLVSTVRARNAQRALSHLASRVAADRRDAMALDSLTAKLHDIAAFETRNRSMTLLLAEITRALPDSCTITQLQIVDSTGGSLVALAPRAAEIVDALERVPLITAPTIAGPVASQSLGGRPLERVSLAFRLVEP